MPSTRSAFILVLFLIGLAATGIVDAHAQSGEEVVAAVRNRLQQSKALSAEFDQTFASEYIDHTESVDGTILLQGDKYRVETPLQTFVTDGKVTWIYNRAENQVLINNFVEDETTFSLNRFLFDFDDRYYVAEMEGAPLDANHYRVTLRAFDASEFFPEVTMVVDRVTYAIARLEVVDANQTLITINLRNLDLNPEVDPRAFTFDPPESSEIVDLRS
ncbi:MAG: outer membrane lipoprotein carrier protein LolA [Rhodothermia bacterium]|nr:outer membrane lipoprotein carrier protein LolA [Rhodothermia bacterium]